MKIEKQIYSNGDVVYKGYGDIVGTFTCKVSGSGNSTVYKITTEGDQYDMEKPFSFEVMGEWEMMDLAKFLTSIAPKN